MDSESFPGRAGSGYLLSARLLCNAAQALAACAPPITAVNLIASAASPQAANTVIALQAGAAGGANVEYQFLVGLQGTKSVTWTTVQGYGPASSYAWKPAKAGSYQLKVSAREVGKATAGEASAQAPYTISAVTATKK